MSLYEESVRSSSWSLISRRLSRRFTTLEGWREIGLGVYAMSNNVRMFSIRHQFDPEQIRDNYPDTVLPVPAISLHFSKAQSERVVSVRLFDDPVQKPTGIFGGNMRFEKGQAVETIIPERQATPEPVIPYHVFSRRRKWLIVVIVSVTGLFPALAANIYLPTLDKVAQDLRISIEAVSLTITSYLAMQGIAALFLTPLADAVGRRPICILSMLMFLASNTVISFSPTFAILVVFRGIQGASVASTVSIGTGIIQDICHLSERDDFFSFYQGIRNFTVIAAPVIGGLFTQFLHFRSVFVFLLGLSIASFFSVLLFLPETLRSIAGNGSELLTDIYRPLVYIGDPALDARLRGSYVRTASRPRISVKNFFDPLRYLKEREIIFGLIFGSTIFAIWSMVTISTVAMFKAAFGLNELLLGFAFIPSGLGAIAGSTIIGNLLNRDFLAASSRYKAARSLPPSATLSRYPLPSDFPIEHTRLARVPLVTTIMVITLCFYGFTCDIPSLYHMRGWITVPLLLQFLIAATSNAAFAIHQTLISDLFPLNGASTAAVCQLVRCIFSAIGVGIVQLMIREVDAGPTFIALGLVVMVLVPLPVIQWYWGEDWRRARERKDFETNAAAEAEEKI
ncbi:major facilitator superfamily transporter [Lophiotrema nucula]|uniref:Major facilitator superfamily transporter n=1 Tax=Lophiotrema nucula TaxID=690887 RepID=A0A6A5Z104_9PLEO|nr:major facilitator superfamily transporter [Lophiotrema nucula]